MTTRQSAAAVTYPPFSGMVEDISIEYPSSDGEPMAESDFQYIPMTETVSALRNWFINRPDIYVAGDMLVYYRMNDNQVSLAPDVFAVIDASGNHPRDSWLVWREGKAPDFVMEIASPSAWKRDATEKREIYAAMGVTEYWRFDPTGECFSPALIAERLVDREYQPIEAAEGIDGVLRAHSSVLGLDFQVESGLELRVYDAVSGERMRNLREETAARQVAEAALETAESENARLRLLQNQQGI